MKDPPMLELHKITLMASGRPRLHDVSCQFEAGKITGIIGPNGAGKTSLLRVAAGLLKPDSGAVLLRDGDFANLQMRVRHLSYLPQFHSIAWPLLCRDVVALGLLPFGEVDMKRVDAALAQCGASAFATRSIQSLSGGEAARVHLARLLVADAPIILLDEPVQSLDAAGAQAIMQLLRRAAQAGKAVGLVIHDLNLARHYCEHVLLLNEGRCVAQGAPSQLFTPEQLKPIFNIEFTQLNKDAQTYILPHHE